MSRQTPEPLRALDRLSRREFERELKHKIWKRARRAALAAAGRAFIAAHYFADQLAWIKEKIPLFEEIWKWISAWLK